MTNKVLKFIFLIAILAIPVIIFLFLKSYGDNRFDIPYYYTRGGISEFPDCSYPQDTFRVAMNNKNNKRANVTLFFSENSEFTSTDLVNTRSRLQALFRDNFSFVAHGFNATMDSASFMKLMHCGFVTDTVNQFILHDDRGIIRGYYKTDLEELDRLIVETKILLENE